jgi:hypothetical protein
MLMSIEQDIENGDDPERDVWKQSLGLLSTAYHTFNVSAISATTTIVTGVLRWRVPMETASHSKHTFFRSPTAVARLLQTFDLSMTRHGNPARMLIS